MLKLIFAALLCYLIYETCKEKDFHMPTIAWIGVGFVIAWILSLI